MKRRGVIIALIIIVLVSLVGTSCIIRGGRGEVIAVIPLSGTIAGTQQVGFLTTSGEVTPGLVRSYLQKAENDSAVKAVVLHIDSPGGTAAASQQIAELIRQFPVEKPVVVSMGDVAASGGYYISVYADKIVAGPATATGSIGVIMQIIYYQGLLEKLGIETETITSPEGEYKGMGTRPLTDEERQILQDMCDEIYEDFVKAVAEGRNLDYDLVRYELATGRSFTGKQALALGMIDELGGLDDAIALAAEIAGVESPAVEWYGREPSLLERLLGILAKTERLLQKELSDDQLLFLRTLEGWQAVPCYLQKGFYDSQVSFP